MLDYSIQVWSALPEEIHELQNSHRHKNLYNIIISDNIDFMTDIKDTVNGKDILLFTLIYIALASGIALGLGYGDNTKATLITRGLAEIEKLGLKMGCLPDTFSRLSGMEDLIITLLQAVIAEIIDVAI